VLHWNKYQGFDFDWYYIYRGTRSDNLGVIDSVKNTGLLDFETYTDLTGTDGEAYYYQVAVKTPEPIYYDIPDRKKAHGGPFAHSLSNLEDNKLKTGIKNHTDDERAVLVYPNPYSDFTNIMYSVGKPGFVKISIYNLLGQKVTDLVSDFQDASEYHVRFSAKSYNQPSGMYFIRIEIGKRVFNRIVVER
jgi:hypothetical protein